MSSDHPDSEATRQHIVQLRLQREAAHAHDEEERSYLREYEAKQKRLRELFDLVRTPLRPGDERPDEDVTIFDKYVRAWSRRLRELIAALQAEGDWASIEEWLATLTEDDPATATVRLLIRLGARESETDGLVDLVDELMRNEDLYFRVWRHCLGRLRDHLEETRRKAAYAAALERDRHWLVTAARLGIMPLEINNTLCGADGAVDVSWAVSASAIGVSRDGRQVAAGPATTYRPDALLAAFDEMCRSESLPPLKAWLRLGKELHRARLGSDYFIYRVIDRDSSLEAPSLRGLLYAASRINNELISAADHNRLNDERHVREMHAWMACPDRWADIKPQLAKFYKACVEELENRSPPIPPRVELTGLPKPAPLAQADEGAPVHANPPGPSAVNFESPIPPSIDDEKAKLADSSPADGVPGLNESENPNGELLAEYQVAEFIANRPNATLGEVTTALGLTPGKVRRTQSWKDHQERLLDEFLRAHPRATADEAGVLLGVSGGKVVGMRAWKSHTARKQADAPPRYSRERPLNDAILKLRPDQRSMDPSNQIDDRDQILRFIVEGLEPQERGSVLGLSPQDQQRLIDHILLTVGQSITDAPAQQQSQQVLLETARSWLEEEEQQIRAQQRRKSRS
jgi:hypothetical protein